MHTPDVIMGLGGLGAGREDGMGVGREWRGRKGMSMQGKHNQPHPPYQLTPNPHTLWITAGRGAPPIQKPISTPPVQMMPKLSPCAQF